jgi:hypothetical protein
MKALIFRETGEPNGVLKMQRSLLRLWLLAKRSSECSSARSTHRICTWCEGKVGVGSDDRRNGAVAQALD